MKFLTDIKDFERVDKVLVRHLSLFRCKTRSVNDKLINLIDIDTNNPVSLTTNSYLLHSLMQLLVIEGASGNDRTTITGYFGVWDIVLLHPVKQPSARGPCVNDANTTWVISHRLTASIQVFKACPIFKIVQADALNRLIFESAVAILNL